MNENEILKGLEAKAYDFIACNYYKLSKEQLKDIILELLAQFDGAEYKQVTSNLIDGLKDFRAWDDEGDYMDATEYIEEQNEFWTDK